MEPLYPKKPEPLHIYEAKSRRCLKCREPFTSSWPGERVCPRCKSSAVWRTGRLLGDEVGADETWRPKGAWGKQRHKAEEGCLVRCPLPGEERT